MPLSQLVELAANHNSLPMEIEQAIALHRQNKDALIDKLGKIVATSRDAAVVARKTSNIETIWREDEEFYIGVDDLNRGYAKVHKSIGMDGVLTTGSANRATPAGNGCTAFFNITRQFVDAATARMGDILLPAGDWNFTIKPTPIPDFDAIKDSSQPVSDAAGAKTNPNGTPYTVGQFVTEESAYAEDKVARAEKRIKDWLVECDYHTEVRKVIEDAAKIGTGILRGAYPDLRKIRAVVDGALVIKEEVVPASKRVDPRDFFPDPSCGDSIQNGNYVLERDWMTARQLRELSEHELYVKGNIIKVLKEGVGKFNVDSHGSIKDGSYNAKDSERFEVWYYFGYVDASTISAIDTNAPAIDGEMIDAVPAIIVMVNDTVIRGYVNPLENGEFPYDVMRWQSVSDSIWGIGVARQGRVAQEFYLASCRALQNNAGISSAPQLVVRRSAIYPQDGDWVIKSGKIWVATEEADVRTVSDAILSINIPSMQQELANNITMALKMMEDSTGVSFMMQGQQGAAPDTVGGMQLLHQNSSSLLRRIARVFDESVTEPHIRRYYDWLLIHGEDDEKGDFQIEAVGSTALVEREIQSQQAAQILQMSLNPAFGLSPKRAAEELLKAWRFIPSRFEVSADERQSAQAPQSPAPQVQAAQIRAEADKEIAQVRAQTDMQRVQKDTDRDTVYVQAQTARDQAQAEYNMNKLEMERELAILAYANKREITLEQVKSDLANTAMKLRVQKELALASGAIPQVATPAVEPAGRAHNGQAFQA